MKKNMPVKTAYLQENSDSLKESVCQKKTVRYLIKKPVLIILDMQKIFISAESSAFLPSSQYLLKELKDLTSLCKKQNIPVIATRHLDDLSGHTMMGKWWHHLITETSEESELVMEIKALADIIINKSQYDAFYQTNLFEELKKLEADTVIICGVQTHLCCETTARSAFCHGFNVIFPADGSCSGSPLFHKASLFNLSHGFAWIPSLSELKTFLLNISSHGTDKCTEQF